MDDIDRQLAESPYMFQHDACEKTSQLEQCNVRAGQLIECVGCGALGRIVIVTDEDGLPIADVEW